MGGEFGQRFVDGVVDHLIDHVVQARAVVGVADVHPRALAHGVQALEDLDGIRAVFGGRFVSFFVGHSGFQRGESRSVHTDAKGPSLEVVEQRFIRAGKESLQRKRLDFVEESGPPDLVQVRRNFVQ